MTPFFGVQSFRNFYDNMPYGGQGGMEWITKRGVFATPMVIKIIPVRDMSLPTKDTYDDFDALVYNVRTNLPVGAKVKGIQVVENRAVSGFVGDVKFDYGKRRVRVFIREEDSNTMVEVYPESVYREMQVRESKSYVMDLSEFVEKMNEG
jgi:hypothetical protein